MRAAELLSAFAAAPGGVGVHELRVHVRPGGSPRIIPGPASHLGANVSRSGQDRPVARSIYYERPAWPPDSN